MRFVQGERALLTVFVYEGYYAADAAGVSVKRDTLPRLISTCNFIVCSVRNFLKSRAGGDNSARTPDICVVCSPTLYFFL